MKLSIVTINYNNAEGLKKTLASVASQTYRNIEHIIIDGGSTDGSVDIIRDYEETIHHTPYTIHYTRFSILFIWTKALIISRVIVQLRQPEARLPSRQLSAK